MARPEVAVNVRREKKIKMQGYAFIFIAMQVRTAFIRNAQSHMVLQRVFVGKESKFKWMFERFD